MPTKPTKATRYLALLRGINVGGKNIIAKNDLKAAFENMGFSNVRTYIQSGNVVFRSESSSVKELTSTIENALSRQFQYAAQAVVISHKRYSSELKAAHKNWGMDAERKHNALFLIAGLKPSKVMSQLPEPKKEYEQVSFGHGTIFWSTSKKELGKTTMMKLAGKPVYKQMTVRNHNTSFKLLALMDEM